MSLSSVTTDESVKKVRSGVGFAILEDYGLIKITGTDATAFLHAQTTNDVQQLKSGEGHVTALLDRKAHIQSFMSLHRLEEVFWILIEKAQIPTVLDRLETYHFTEDVKMQDCTGDYTLCTLQGPESRRLVLKITGKELIPISENAIWQEPAFWETSAMVICKSYTGEEGYVIALPPEKANLLCQQLQDTGKTFDIIEMSRPVMEVLRIEAGIPRFGVDMDAGTLLPETGLEHNAVSYTKGCYLGQEVVARVKTYGSVQKALVGLVLEENDPLPPLDTSIIIDDKQVGTVKSGVFSPLLKAPVAMAYLAREYRVPGKVLEFVADRTTYTATVTWLPFYTASGVTERAKAKYDEALQLFAQDQDEQAIVLLRAAIELDPHLSDAYEALGVILSRHEEYEEAISLMHKLAEIDPESVMAHTNLSMFYMKQGMKEEAEAEKEKATLLGFKKAMAERQSLKSEEEQRLQRQQALEDKVQMFQEVLALDAEDALANYGLGNTFLELGRNQEAAPLLEKAVQMDPKYTVAYLALGKVYEALKNVDQARQTYEKGIEVAAQRGDLMPLQEMQRRLAAL